MVNISTTHTSMCRLDTNKDKPTNFRIIDILAVVTKRIISSVKKILSQIISYVKGRLSKTKTEDLKNPKSSNVDTDLSQMHEDLEYTEGPKNPKSSNSDTGLSQKQEALELKHRENMMLKYKEDASQDKTCLMLREAHTESGQKGLKGKWLEIYPSMSRESYKLVFQEGNTMSEDGFKEGGFFKAFLQRIKNTYYIHYLGSILENVFL